MYVPYNYIHDIRNYCIITFPFYKQFKYQSVWTKSPAWVISNLRSTECINNREHVNWIYFILQLIKVTLRSRWSRVLPSVCAFLRIINKKLIFFNRC